ncbi:hypothetical protein JOS77_14155 [Chromobacterium haemolyticum]|nr:hypothetical protein JOS77_14155 [Chromobacterium haemolyticum]
MAKLKPLSDTQRVVEWEELPASVRDVPDNFDPLADGVLMKHQRQWVALKASLKACPKGRRTGITLRRRSAGRHHHRRIAQIRWRRQCLLHRRHQRERLGVRRLLRQVRPRHRPGPGRWRVRY